MVIFSPSIEIKVIGEYGQIGTDLSIPYRGELRIRDFLNKPGLQGRVFFPMRTTPKAKLTDFMNSAEANFPSQIIVNNKLRDIFEEFPGQSFEVGKLAINHASRSLDYYLIARTERMDEKIIDFKNSKIAELNWRAQKYEPLNCEAIDEMKKIKDAVFVNVAFFDNVIADLHHFVCPLTNELFISDEMAKAMIDEKISGVELYAYDRDSDITQLAKRNLPRLL